MTFGKILKRLREGNNYTMDRLIELYNNKFNGKMNKSTLSRYENGLQEPMFTVVVNLAKLFNVTVDFLSGSTFDEIENTVQITRRAGTQKRYTLSDKQTDVIEGMLEQMPKTSVFSPYGGIVAEGEETKSSFAGSLVAHGGESNKTGKKRVKPTIHD